MGEYVYESSDDTRMLLDSAVRAIGILNNIDCAEVGFGMGEVLLALARMPGIMTISASDTNTDAHTNARRMMEGLDDNTKSKIVLSEEPFLDGFGNRKFDIILFNPPYLPSDSTDRYLSENEKRALIGGRRGVEVSISFLERLSEHVHSNSIILLIASSLSNLPLLEQSMRKLGYYYSVYEKKAFGFEQIYCYYMTPGEALKYALSNNTRIGYLSKGSRSYAYTVESNNKIILKQGINDMSANFQKEFEILRLLQGIIRVPRPYNILHNLIVMERISGIRADRHDEIMDIAVFLLDAAMVLDALMIFKKEFSRPFTNLIVSDSDICIIDFERAIIGRRGNMNQLCEFLKRGGLLDEQGAKDVRRENDEFSEMLLFDMKEEGLDYSSINQRIMFFKKNYSDRRVSWHKRLIGHIIIRG